MTYNPVSVIGGGLAGAEAAWYLAECGIPVCLYEMRPQKMTPAHTSDKFAEIVCSNSLKSDRWDSASGQLKWEMRMMGSLLLRIADQTRVPAGHALAVDRERFSDNVTQALESHKLITIIREEVTSIDQSSPVIIATGPLTSDKMADTLSTLVGQQHLSFCDAIAPSVEAVTLDRSIVFGASRYDKGDTDSYLNCPFNKAEYEQFYEALMEAARVPWNDVDKPSYFEGCLPVEVLAERGIDTLRYGPMKPVGLTDPRTGRRPWACIQLRQENAEGTVFGLVGCQTRMKWPDQARVFRLVPGLQNVEFTRYGAMHRNTFVNAPLVLTPSLQLQNSHSVYLAGQITGVEGYVESAATGILAALNISRMLQGKEPVYPPKQTILGSLLNAICYPDTKHFQPVNANLGIIEEEGDHIRSKKDRYAAKVLNAQARFTEWWQGISS